jgi:outer membrane protein assembly factor BamD (BamD/ComL family)
MSENEKRNYELCYNSACLSISKGNYEEALTKLERAEKMCQQTYEEEEDQDTLESEIAIIRQGIQHKYRSC